MDPNSGALFPPLGKSPQRAKTAHTTSSLPIAGSARVSTHPLLPPHHIRRRNQVHLHLRNQQHRHDRVHARHKTDSAKAPCSMTDHIVGLYEAPELPEVEGNNTGKITKQSLLLKKTPIVLSAYRSLTKRRYCNDLFSVIFL